MTIKIKDWSDHYEKSDSRKCKGAMKWIAVPTKMDGKSYRRLAKMKDCAELFTCWILLLQLAGKMPVRGVLKDEDGDLSTEDMELMTGYPQALFERSIPVLASRKIGWIEAPGYANNTNKMFSDKVGQAALILKPSGEHPELILPVVGENSDGPGTTVQYNTIHNNTIQSIVGLLNSQAGTNYKYSTKETGKKIMARVKEGYKLGDFHVVIMKKCKEWMGTEHEKFLRPETLFGNKFESYLNQQINKEQSNGTTSFSDQNADDYRESKRATEELGHSAAAHTPSDNPKELTGDLSAGQRTPEEGHAGGPDNNLDGGPAPSGHELSGELLQIEQEEQSYTEDSLSEDGSGMF